jgi:L-fuculose-phosphate aldolase
MVEGVHPVLRNRSPRERGLDSVREEEHVVKRQPVVPFPDTQSLRESVLETYRKLTDLGFILGTWGNISVRIEEGILVTPSRVSIEQMTLADLVTVTMAGERLGGKRLPSSEMHVHRLLLLERPDIGAFVHTHSPFATVVACCGRSIPVITEDMAQIIGGEVHCTTYTPAGRHLALAEEARRKIGPSAAALLLGNHGPIVGGRDLSEAIVASRVLEKASRVVILGEALGGAETIPAAKVEEERHRFLYKYGSEKDTAQ